MNKRVELPLAEPLYSTYHYQGSGSATIISNPSIRNWYFNQVMNLTCTRKFLSGFTTPEITVADSAWNSNPCFDKRWYSMQFAKGSINPIIRELLDHGYYIAFDGVDDFYVKGKSWYHEKHFNHDGLICGYDTETKEYCVYAYDSNWIYRKFWVSWDSWNNGRKAMLRKKVYGNICGLKPKPDQVAFQPELVLKNIKEYLDSPLRKEPKKKEGPVRGIAVQDYIAMYLDKLYDGSIPYEKMDRRVFRLIWEHKKVMLERLKKAEEELKLDHKSGNAYEWIVSEANTMRMLYASHHLRRRDSVLPIIRNKLIAIKKRERTILKNFVRKAERKIVNETVE